MMAVRMLVSMSTWDSLKAKTRTAFSVYGPTPGRLSKSAPDNFFFADNFLAASCRYFALLLYPRPLHSFSTSENGALASLLTVGNFFKNDLYFSSPRGTRVCCNITSDTRILYGSFVCRHGRS